ncbi:tripartite tricarboxylate transporter substrate-binding protein [Muricoccus vinaceus]|uniref:Tripartite tricarboxylate transporter substrate-binding protein n=1 Tax=Muricoccus vinaceus TaxID=424704 RepID=A0ABV6INJ5_9PROT
MRDILTDRPPGCVAQLTRRALGAALLLPAAARAQGPNGGSSTRPVTIIAPFGPGTPPDLVARMLAEALQRQRAQPFVVDNRPGASGTIGAAAVARAAPDGQTLLIATGTAAMNVSLFRSLPYDPVGSFAPVVLLASVPFAIIAHPAAGATLPEVVARARANPGRVNYATPGVGTPHHVATEMLRQRTGIQIEHVPYRAAGGAVADILNGTVSLMFLPAPQAVELSRDGRVRVLAVATEARLPELPAVPTTAEAGVPDMLMSDWYGLFAPGATPPDTVLRLNEAVNAVLPAMTQPLAAQGMTSLGGPPERLRALFAAEIARWAAVIRTGGISAE